MLNLVFSRGSTARFVDRRPLNRRPHRRGLHRLHRVAWAVGVLGSGLLPAAWADEAATVVVTGNPLGRDSLAQPSSVLAGDGLMLRRASTLGDTLQGLPGVAGSGFGPNSNRPLIRGLDGDRVRLLDNGGASIDASNLSFDHAVAQDPLVAERIELVRGPAALLYGGNATGGVVNSLDNRVPRAPVDGLSARSEVRLGGAADERSASVVLDGGNAGAGTGAGGGWAWHADAFGRRSSDLRVPAFDAPVGEDDALLRSDRVRNSAARAWGGAIGASRVGSSGFAGLSADTYRNDYGVTVEPDVLIRMQRDRLALAGEQRHLTGPFETLSVQASHTRYRHEEVEGDGEVGTTFASRGQDLRLQATQARVGPWQGVLGLQAERLDFSALGEEAFVPNTRTRSLALFTLQQLDIGDWRLQAGLRSERVRVASEGDGVPAADATDGDLAREEPRFGDAASRRFTPTSASLGGTWTLAPGLALTLDAAHTERAPAYYELYANGVHLATAAYERGDPSLGLERSRALGLTVEWRSGANHVKASWHHTRFDRFIALAASGESISTEDGDTVPEYRFEGVRARLQGFEIDGRWRALDGPLRLDLTASADAVRGDDLDHGEPLPRLAPRRLQLGAVVSRGPWAVGADVRGVARQTRVPATDTATPGYGLWGAWASWRLDLAGQAVTAFVRLDNLGDRLAYNASAVATVRVLSPLPGRALSAGLRWTL